MSGSAGTTSPPATIKVHRTIHDDLIAHAREESPRECCGLLVGLDGLACRAYRTTNVAADPVGGFEIAADEARAIEAEASAAGLGIVASYHSHPAARAIPSASDREMGRADVVQIIVGMHPNLVVRAFRADEYRVEDVPLEVF
jgi:proteasome lid subunit RPN8/RPN11